MRPSKKKGSKVTKKPLPIEIDEQEFTKLVHIAPYMHHRVAFLLAWASGCRVSEVIGLQKGDFNFEEKSIRINMGKNSKDRIVPLPAVFKKHLLQYIPIPCKQRALQKAFKLYAKRCGILENKPKARFHSLRHGFATHCLRVGISLPAIQGHLGHEDLQTTGIYTNLVPKERLEEYQEKF